MTSEQFPNDSRQFRRVRTLKIEAAGDAWRNSIKPQIRLMGRWLEMAGFKPGERVQVVCTTPGVIELRSTVPANSNAKFPALVQSDLMLNDIDRF